MVYMLIMYLISNLFILIYKDTKKKYLIVFCVYYIRSCDYFHRYFVGINSCKMYLIKFYMVPFNFSKGVYIHSYLQKC